MRNLPIVTLLAGLALLMAGCRHTPDPRLARAEALMDERPDSALAILDSVVPSSLRGGGDRALHAMLLTMARDKNYLDPTDDSLISVAVDYYRTHDDPLRSAISSYYQGRVYYLKGNPALAVTSYARAKDVAELNGLHFWAGMACRGISIICRESYNAEDALVYARRELEHHRKSRVQPFLDYAQYDYGLALYNRKEYDSALLIAESLVDTATLKEDAGMMYGALQLKEMSLASKGRRGEALAILRQLLSHPYAQNQDSVDYGQLLYETGEEERAMRWLDSVSDQGWTMTHYLRSLHLAREGNFREALQEMRSFDSINVVEYKRAVSNTVMSDLDNFHTLNRQLDQASIRELRLRNTLILVLGAGVLLTVILLFRRRMMRHRREMSYAREVTGELRRALGEYEARQKASSELASRLRDTISRLEADAGDNLRVTGELREALAKAEARETQVSGLLSVLRETECDFLDEVGRIAGSNLGTERVNPKLVVILSKFLTAYSKDGDKVGKLEEYADLMHSGIVGAFRAEPLHLKEADYRLFLYSVLGFSTATITLLLGEDKADKVYNRRYRIKAKVQELPEERRGTYDQYL